MDAKTLLSWAERIEKAIGHIDNLAPEYARHELEGLKGEVFKAVKQLPRKQK